MTARLRIRKSWRLSILLVLVMAVALGTYLWWRGEDEINFVRYEEFGIDMPVSYSVHGIDVSKFQKDINWQAVRQMKVDNIRLSFVFVKATEGITRQDATFQRNWRKAGQAGMIRGAYHFFYATRDPLKQAINFQNVVQLQSGDLPPVLDIEVHNNQPAAVISGKWIGPAYYLH